MIKNQHLNNTKIKKSTLILKIKNNVILLLKPTSVFDII